MATYSLSVPSLESEQQIQADVFLSRIHTRPIYFKLAYLINCLKDTVWIHLLMSISEISAFQKRNRAANVLLLTPSLPEQVFIGEMGLF